LSLRKVIIDTAKEIGVAIHSRGTAVSIEGPRFSTKAESHLFRSWNCDLVNMTLVPEVVLAKEAGLLYASIAMVSSIQLRKVRIMGKISFLGHGLRFMERMRNRCMR
jgi:purine nucleoside phosphorylase